MKKQERYGLGEDALSSLTSIVLFFFFLVQAEIAKDSAKGHCLKIVLLPFVEVTKQFLFL